MGEPTGAPEPAGPRPGGRDPRRDPWRDPTGRAYRWPRRPVAAVAVVVLAVALAMVVVLVPHPLEGPVFWAMTFGHGLHVGDALALVPIVGGAGLARHWWSPARVPAATDPTGPPADDGGPDGA